MDRQSTIGPSDLEHMLLDESVEPRELPLSLLENITGGFSCDQEIGSGGFAVVYKGTLPNRLVAVKKLINLHAYENKFTQEVGCLTKAKHKNIVRFLGYCADTQGQVKNMDNNFVLAELRERLLCFEYLPGSLDVYTKDISNGLQWKKSYQIIKGICEGLHYLHENHIAHLDMKPSNILLDDNKEPKIADFGLSRWFGENKTRTITSSLVGTLGYMAPEYFSGEITLKFDIFSLGVIISEILTGKKHHDEIEEVLESWRNMVDIRENQLEQIRVCAEIGKECRDNNPKRRPSTQNILDRLVKMERTRWSTETSGSTSSVTTADRFCNASPCQRPVFKEQRHDLGDGKHINITGLLDYFVVVDFKATCEKGLMFNPQEIIEFSSVLVDPVTGNSESPPFHSYLRPQERPVLTDFCREYNGIQQTDVDKGIVLAEALPKHEAWLKEAETKKGRALRFAIVTWGDWDCRSMLDRECRHKGVASPQYFHQWIDLKIPFMDKFGREYIPGSALKALTEAGLLWEGRRNGGFYNAHNKARLLGFLVQQGVQFSITSKLEQKPAPKLLYSVLQG